MLFYSKVRVCEVCLFDYSILIKKIVKDSMLKIGSQPTNTFCISVFCMPTVFFHQLNPAKITLLHTVLATFISFFQPPLFSFSSSGQRTAPDHERLHDLSFAQKLQAVQV